MRRWDLVCVCLVVFAVLDGAPAATGAAAPAGLSLARAVRIALERVPVESYEQVGFAYALAEQGPAPVFRWRWGGGPVQGMVPVRERATVGLTEGRVSWWRDDLRPLPCVEAPLCGEVSGAQVPVELLLLASGAFYAYGDQASHGCFGRLGGSTPVALGGRTWALFGDFAAPRNRGATMLLQSSFPWALTGGMAGESTAVSQRTHLPLRQQTTVTPAGPGEPFSFSASFSYPTRAPAPQAKLCRATK